MSAPSSVYQTYKTRRRKAGTPDVDVDLYIAKFLQNTTPPSGDDWGDGYFDSDDTEQDKIDKIKGIFKIDGWNQADYAEPKTGTITISGTSVTGSGTAFTTDFVVGQKLGALQLIDDELKCVETYTITAITSATAMSVVAGTNRSGISYALYRQGFIGYCYSRTSGNGLYHKTERFSGVRVPTSAQASAELLNDGSLNLMGTCSISAVASDLENNAINVTGVFRSSFYNPTTAFGVKWSGIARRHLSTGYDTPTTWTRDIDKGPIAPKIKVTQTATQYQEQYLTDPYYEFIAGEEYTITPYITNEEGRKEGTAIVHLMSGISAQMSYGTTAALAAASSTFETVYKWNRGLLAYLEADGYVVPGTRFDMTANGSSGDDYPTAGWWAYPAASGTTIRLCVQLDEYGVCTGILYINTSGGGSGSGNPEIQQYDNIAGYSFTSQSASITAARGNLWQTAYTLFWNITLREWGWSELVGEELQWHTAEEGWYCRVVYIGLTEVVVEVLHIDAYGNLDASSGQMTVAKT